MRWRGEMSFSLMLEWGGVSVTLSAVYRGGVGTRLHKAVLSPRLKTATCLKAALSLLSLKCLTSRPFCVYLSSKILLNDERGSESQLFKHIDHLRNDLAQRVNSLEIPY
jgi:hypothetical protein